MAVINRYIGSISTWMQLVLLCWIAQVTHQATYRRSSIILKDNGYEGIVVAIEDQVKPSNNTLIDIKNFINHASNELLIATRGQVFIRNVTIFLPESWSEVCDLPSISCQQSATETLETANIIIGEASNLTFTRQKKGCGQEGDFIYFPVSLCTLKYVKRLVHEFAHLRWGLFDESPQRDGSVPACYFSLLTGELRFTTCPRSMQAHYNSSCLQNEKQCQDYEKCTVKPLQNASISYMFVPLRVRNVIFCDNNTDSPQTLHNSEAPTKQNKLCKNKSCWEIMRQHADFTSTAPLSGEVNTTVTFKYVTRRKRAVVIVMDKSESMRPNDGYKNLENQTRQYILKNLAAGIYLGLVSFDQLGYVLSNLTLLTESNRDALADMVNIEPQGGETSIGDAINSALQILEWAAMDRPGSEICLITDGRETDEPWISEVMPTVLERKIKLEVILIGKEAQADLLAYAVQTGGTGYLFTGREGTLGSILSEAIHSGNNAVSAYLVGSSTLDLSPGGNSYSVYIDESLGEHTTFTITCLGRKSSLQAQIKDPTNTTVYSVTLDDAIIHTYTVPGTATAGLWNIIIHKQGQEQDSAQIQVDSRVRSNATHEPIELEVSASQTTIGSGDGSQTSCPAIYATLTRKYNPVCGAEVKAYIEGRNTGLLLELPLYDTGAGADIFSNDGVYSACVFPFNRSDVYSIRVRVIGLNATVMKKASGSASYDFDDEGVALSGPLEIDPVQAFERFAIGPAFQVMNAEDRSDTIPPLEIHDLRIMDVKSKENLMYLQFTAVGDDYDHGFAHHYEIRYAATIESVSNNFEAAEAVELVYGRIESPAEAGKTETFGFRVRPKHNYCIAIRVWDDANNSSPLSNVVCATITEYYSQGSTPSVTSAEDVVLEHTPSSNVYAFSAHNHPRQSAEITDAELPTTFSASFATSSYEAQTSLPSSVRSPLKESHFSPDNSAAEATAAELVGSHSRDYVSAGATSARPVSEFFAASVVTVISEPTGDTNGEERHVHTPSTMATVSLMGHQDLEQHHLTTHDAYEVDAGDCAKMTGLSATGVLTQESSTIPHDDPERCTTLTTSLNSQSAHHSSLEDTTFGITTEVGYGDSHDQLSRTSAETPQDTGALVSSSAAISKSDEYPTSSTVQYDFTSPAEEFSEPRSRGLTYPSFPDDLSNNSTSVSSYYDLLSSTTLVGVAGTCAACIVCVGVIFAVVRLVRRRALSHSYQISTLNLA